MPPPKSTEMASGLVALLSFTDYSRFDSPGQACGDLSQLQALAPKGSLLWTHRRSWTGTMDGYVSWNVVVLSPSALGEEEWMEMRAEMMRRTQMDDPCNRDGVRVAAPGKKAAAVDAWEREITGRGVGTTMGSLEKIRTALAWRRLW